MNKQKVMEIVLSSQSNDGRQEYGALLLLPATTDEIRDACQRARFWDYLATPKYINILRSDCPRQLDNYDLAEPVTIEELNFFASRVEGLPEYQKIALEAVFSRYSNEGRFRNGVSVKDLINLTYGLGDVIVVEGIVTDEDLGDYVINNDLHPDVSAVPDNSVYLLDSVAIGRLQKENDQGMYIDDHYVATANYEMPEVYDGKVLPITTPPERWCAFKLKVAEAPIAQPGDTEHTAAWLTLPMEDDAVARFAKAHNEERIEDCVCYGMISGVSQITEQHFFDMRNFHKLNSLAWRMTYMSSEEQCRFKAALELEKPETMDDVMDIAENLHRYEFSDTLGDEDSYFRRILAIFLPPQFDKHWLDNVYFHKQGEQMLNMIGGKVTPYGVISGRDQPLYAQYLLGRVLLMGEDVPQDRDKGSDLIRKSADSGNTTAAYTMGKLLLEGMWIPQDIKTGMEYMTKAAEDHFSAAQYYLGKVLYEGKLVPKDTPKAVAWLERSAQSGNTYGAYLAGKILLTDESVKDPARAVRNFELAAQYGNDYAEYQLGKLYLSGKDIPQDYEKAFAYLNAAASHGNQYAAQMLKSIHDNRNWNAAVGSIRLLHHMSRMLKNQAEEDRKELANVMTDRKLRRQIEEKKQAQGLKS